MTPEPTMTVSATGTKRWQLDGQRHRVDGPAVEWADGDQEWWVNGLLHRTDGPAAEYVNGYIAWWLNGREYSLELYCRHLYGDEWAQHYLMLTLRYA